MLRKHTIGAETLLRCALDAMLRTVRRYGETSEYIQRDVPVRVMREDRRQRALQNGRQVLRDWLVNELLLARRRSALVLATAANNVDVMRLLVEEYGADVESTVSSKVMNNSTLLHVASGLVYSPSERASNGLEYLISVYSRRGMLDDMMERRDSGGWTCLATASIIGCDWTVDRLLECGANCNMRIRVDPLHADYGDDNNEADEEDEDRRNVSLVCRAASFGRWSSVTKLVAYGAQCTLAELVAAAPNYGTNWMHATSAFTRGRQERNERNAVVRDRFDAAVRDILGTGDCDIDQQQQQQQQQVLLLPELYDIVKSYVVDDFDPIRDCEMDAFELE
eukprot:TRINITY_DN65647_c8_g11_i2.p1 TRINITY_DN65647_c8_g11~~TRINITY_DN65647_c8_g11_i2.p1  ORF type:complete len:337 (+),score=163.59 TRINITY_DN65647_c8_g11_i2:2-1012(+)